MFQIFRTYQSCHILRQITKRTFNSSIVSNAVKFTESHEWISVEENVGTVGITNYAQNSLGDVIYVELPKVGENFEKKAQVNVVESVKAVSYIYAPVSGEVTEINKAVEKEPSLINKSAMKNGWLFRLKLKNPADLESLLDETAYNKLIH